MRRVPTPKRTSSRRASATFRIVPTALRHTASIVRIVRRAHAVDDDELCLSCPTSAMVRRQIRRFPEGQFVAVRGEGDDERVLGVAVLMRTDRPPSAEPKSWLSMIGGLGLRNHEPNGRWLYGVETAVDPDAQGQGVGSALYRRRLELVRELGVEGMYAGGMLKGYRRFRDRMTPLEYAERVRSGEIVDPTVTMQLRRGFQAVGVIENYEDDEEAGNCAMLIVWRPEQADEGGSEGRVAAAPAGSERRSTSPLRTRRSGGAVGSRTGSQGSRTGAKRVPAVVPTRSEPDSAS